MISSIKYREMKKNKHLDEYFKKEAIQEKNKMSEENKNVNLPINKFRIGTVALSQWKNKSKDDKEFSTYSLDVSYFDDSSGQYKEAKAFSKNQLLNIKLCIEKALLNDVTE